MSYFSHGSRKSIADAIISVIFCLDNPILVHFVPALNCGGVLVVRRVRGRMATS
jgi:hypothetical protein